MSSNRLLFRLAPLVICCACARSSGSHDAGEESTGTALQVPLPPTWLAEAGGPEGPLTAGPPGRPVLRIDRVVDSPVPSADELKRSFSESSPGAQVREERRLETPRFVGIVLRRTETSTPPSLLFLAAVPTRQGVVMCASLPGAIEQEIKQALAVCQSLEEGPRQTPSSPQ